ncbi:MAG: hypothetical protein HN757_10935, partial [Calditrichaeota bacterium]|nr:hypothetical protein [Calditrichota bacterium]
HAYNVRDALRECNIVAETVTGETNAMIEQVQTDLHDIKVDIREIRSGNKTDQAELWKALNALRESITGNSKDGLLIRVDRNTNFRKNITRLLWALFSPLYGGLIVLLLKTLFNN